MHVRVNVQVGPNQLGDERQPPAVLPDVAVILLGKPLSCDRIRAANHRHKGGCFFIHDTNIQGIIGNVRAPMRHVGNQRGQQRNNTGSRWRHTTSGDLHGCDGALAYTQG